MVEKHNWLRKLIPGSILCPTSSEMRMFLFQNKIGNSNFRLFSPHFGQHKCTESLTIKLKEINKHRVECAQPMRYAFVKIYCVRKHSTISFYRNLWWIDFLVDFCLFVLSFIAIHLAGRCLFEINEMEQGRVKYVAGIVLMIILNVFFFSKISNYENTFVRFLHFIGQRPNEFDRNDIYI